MQINLTKLLCSTVFVTLLLSINVQGQSNQVSSKLDFDEAEDNNNNKNKTNTNSNVPVISGVVQGRTDGQNGADATGGSSGGNAAGSATGSNRGEVSDSKSRPKIHGVRVTVDTGDTHKSKESKESVEITDVGKHKKRVGIHTDITFEITANGDDEGNATSSQQRSDADKEDASVPIFKGRGGATHKPRKPHDPKTHWNPSYSAERGSYDANNWRASAGTGAGGSGGTSYAGYYPHYPNSNVPVYTGYGEGRGRSGAGGVGTVYRRADGWNSYTPNTARWTTERSTYYDPYRPNSVTGYRAPSWKPCYCMTTGDADNRRRRDSVHEGSIVQPTSSVIEVIDAKLENPFSKK